MHGLEPSRFQETGDDCFAHGEGRSVLLFQQGGVQRKRGGVGGMGNGAGETIIKCTALRKPAQARANDQKAGRAYAIRNVALVSFLGSRHNDQNIEQHHLADRLLG